jgi:hypothetical protein
MKIRLKDGTVLYRVFQTSGIHWIVETPGRVIREISHKLAVYLVCNGVAK